MDNRDMVEFDASEDEYRKLFRMPTREEAAALAKERKKNKLSRFEELIPEDETEEPEDTGKKTEESNDDGNDSADSGNGSEPD